MPNQTSVYLASLAAALFSFYELFQLSLFNVIGPTLLTNFHLTAIGLGLFSASFLLANAGGLIIVGLLIDRYSIRQIGLFFFSISIIACFGLALSHSIWLSILFRSFEGLASAASLLVCVRTNIECFKKDTNLAVGIGIAIALCGGIVGNSIFAHLVSEQGWRGSLITAGIIGLVSLFFMFLYLYDRRDFNDFSKDALPIKWLNELQKAFTYKPNLVAGIYLGLMSVPIFILGTLWGNYYLAVDYKISVNKASLFSSLLFIGMILGSPFWGYLADNVTQEFKIIYIATTASIILSLLLFTHHLGSLYLSIIIFSIGFFISAQNLVYALISRINPLARISTATTVAAIILNGIGAFMQSLFGWMLKMSITPNKINIILFISSFVLAGILIIFLRDSLAERC